VLWKLAFTLTVVLLIAGRTPVLRNPLVRLLLPRSWVTALSILPSRRSPPTVRPGPGPDQPVPRAGRNWSDRRARLILIALALAGIAALLATRATIWGEANAPIPLPRPDRTALPPPR
jgi:hypothetical protein